VLNPNAPRVAGSDPRAGFRPASGSFFTVGQTQVTCTATDANGNTSTDTFTLTLRSNQPVGGTVPATLSLTLGTPAAFGAFTPGITRTYTAASTANVISSAGDATLSVTDPSTTAPGHLVNGTFVMPTALQARAGTSAFAPVSGTPATLKSYSAPVSNDNVTLGFRQRVNANDALRTGAYSKTLTFTLSTTTP